MCRIPSCSGGSACDFAHDAETLKRAKRVAYNYMEAERAKMGWVGSGGEAAARAKAAAAAPPKAGPAAKPKAGPGAAAAAAAAGPSARSSGGSSSSSARPAAAVDRMRAAGINIAPYKMRVCRHVVARGRCPFAETCCFAHSEEELREHAIGEKELQRQLAKLLKGPAATAAASKPQQAAQRPNHQQQQQQQQQQLPAWDGAGAGGGGLEATPLDQMGAREMDPDQLAALMAEMAQEEDELPEAFTCPITQARRRGSESHPGRCRHGPLEVPCQPLPSPRQTHPPPAAPHTRPPQERLCDPVVAADGVTYERGAIEAWLSARGTSPLTNESLEDRLLIPNHTLLAAMQAVLGAAG